MAAAVADELDAPLDVLVVRKIGAPFNPELGVGAIAFGGGVVYNEPLLASLGLTEESLEATKTREQAELARRESAYRGDRPQPVIAGKTIILVDDGVATGATMYAAAMAIRELAPAQLLVAVPTCSVEAKAWLEEVVDEVIALATPEPYIAVGAWYRYFPQLEDSEVVETLSGRHSREETRV